MESKHKPFSLTFKFSPDTKSRNSRPQSGHNPSNRRDPNWMKLFNSKSAQRLQFKSSKLHQYSAKVQSPSIEINPKFSINAMPLFQALIKEPQSESFNIPKKFKPLAKIDEISQLTERNLSLSRLSGIKANNQHSFTSRPSTARKKEFLKEYIPQEIEFLPNKGHQFVSEVLQIWKNMDTEKLVKEDWKIEEEEGSFTGNFDEKSYGKQRNGENLNVVLKIPKMDQECQEATTKVDIRNHVKKRPMTSRNFIVRSKTEKEENLEINAQQKILSTRPSRKSILQFSLSSRDFPKF